MICLETEWTSVSHATKRKLVREALLLFAIALVVTGGSAWLKSNIGWIGNAVRLLTATTLLYLPIEFLSWKGLSSADFGIHWHDLGRALRLFVWVSLIVFPPYLVGFHVWQTQWLQKRQASALTCCGRWPSELKGAPQQVEPPEEEVQLFTTADARFWLRWNLPPGQRFLAAIEGGGRLIGSTGSTLVQADRFFVEGHQDRNGRYNGRATFLVEGRAFSIDIEAGGDRLPAARLRLGADRITAADMPYRAEYSYWWLLNFTLVQLLLVALPEEVFFRGYLQTRLDQIFDAETRVLRVDISIASVCVTSILFAIAHLLTVPSPYRLAVFFPSLLFGWMRRACDSVASAVFFHAACNVFLEIASRCYIT